MSSSPATFLVVVALATLTVSSRAELPADTRDEAPVLSLDRALALARQQSPLLSASREDLSAARHRLGQARAGFFPQLSLSLGYKRGTMNQAMPPYVAQSSGSPLSSYLSRQSMDNYDSFSAALTVTQTLWDGMRTIGAYQAAQALAQSAQADTDTTETEVCVQVIQGYFQALAAEEATAAAAEVERQMAHHLEVARAQVEAEVRQPIDVARAEADLATARLAVLRARNGHELARLSLAVAMGASEPGRFRLSRPARPPEQPLPPVAQAVREALGRRPEWRSLEAKLRAAQHQLTVARSGFWPTASASASWSHAGYELASMPYNWSVGLSLSWSAMQGLQTQHQSGEAAANYRALAATEKGLALAVRAEVEAALTSYREARARREPTDALVAAARETLRLASGRYAAGAGGIVEITDAQTLYAQARLEVIRVELDTEVAETRLRAALGLPACTRGGFR